MPKLTGPLFSLEARKDLGKAITFQRRPGGASVYGYKKPKVPLTERQLWQRYLITTAVAYWQWLSDAVKAEWEAKAKGRGQSGYSLFMHEETASFSNALSNGSFEVGDPPTGWDTFHATASRESGIVKIGNYSLKLHTPTANDGLVRQTVPDPLFYAGRQVTFGMWCRAKSTNTANSALRIIDGVGVTNSEVIPKDDDWHWMMFSRTITAVPTILQVLGFVAFYTPYDEADVLYVDGARLIIGDSIPEFLRG